MGMLVNPGNFTAHALMPAALTVLYVNLYFGGEDSQSEENS